MGNGIVVPILRMGLSVINNITESKTFLLQPTHKLGEPGRIHVFVIFVIFFGILLQFLRMLDLRHFSPHGSMSISAIRGQYQSPDADNVTNYWMLLSDLNHDPEYLAKACPLFGC